MIYYYIYVDIYILYTGYCQYKHEQSTESQIHIFGIEKLIQTRSITL